MQQTLVTMWLRLQPLGWGHVSFRLRSFSKTIFSFPRNYLLSFFLKANINYHPLGFIRHKHSKIKLHFSNIFDTPYRWFSRFFGFFGFLGFLGFLGFFGFLGFSRFSNWSINLTKNVFSLFSVFKLKYQFDEKCLHIFS